MLPPMMQEFAGAYRDLLRHRESTKDAEFEGDVEPGNWSDGSITPPQEANQEDGPTGLGGNEGESFVCVFSQYRALVSFSKV